MAGFFSIEQTKSLDRVKGRSMSCVSCGMLKECQHPRMAPWGKMSKGIMILCEFPSPVDDEQGRPWCDREGNFLKKALSKYGIDLYEDCLTIHACMCAPADGKVPDTSAYNCCRRHVLRAIKERRPLLILAFGLGALHSLYGHLQDKGLGKMVKWRGFTIPDQSIGAWVCPMYPPAYVKSAESPVVEVIWEQDIFRALSKLKEEFPYVPNIDIEEITDLSKLDDIPSGALVAFDYETTGLKPHAKGHRIVCASVAYKEAHAYVFMMPKDRRFLEPFLRFLRREDIYKVAHNMKYEEAWSVVQLGCPVCSWAWDTMQAAHILDNRPNISGLKFQTFIQFGVLDYASEVSPYLQAEDDKNANSLNRIDELLKSAEGRAKLLKYCGLDSVYERMLAQKQQEEFSPF